MIKRCKLVHEQTRSYVTELSSLLFYRNLLV